MAAPLKKAAPKASTKKGTTKSAPKTVSRSSAPKGVTVIPEGSTVIPDHKYDDVIGYLEGSFPEIGKHDETLYLLLAIVDSAMPGPNLRFSYSKVRETFKDTLKSKLTHWDLSKMGSEGDVDGYNEFLVSGLKGLLDNICGYNTSPAVVNNTVIVQPVIPIPQRSDGDLIKLFVEEPRDEVTIAELEKRSKGAPFMAYKGTGTTECDQGISLELLKIVRKGGAVPLHAWGCNVYTIAQLDIKNRVRHECPLCRGISLVRGVCPMCEHDFNPLSLNQRRRIRVSVMVLNSPRIGQEPSSLVYSISAFRAIKDVKALLDASYEVSGSEALDFELSSTGRSPTLLIVDDPIIFEEHHKEILKSVDAFHRNLGGK